MPIVSWNCSVCDGQGVGLDHYELTACGDKIHPDYPAAILRHERGHYRHGRKVIGVTDIIGCPRKAAMSKDVEYSIDPCYLNSPSTGSAWDAWVSGKRQKGELVGVFGGVQVIGEPDRVRDGVVEDWKHGNDFAKKYRKEAKADHKAQVNMYAQMLAQVGEMVRGARIWYHFTSEFGWPVDVPLWDMDHILEYKPVEGPTTVTEHLAFLEGWKIQKIQWQDIPMIGEQQSYGAKSACEYCALREVCWTQAKGAAF